MSHADDILFSPIAKNDMKLPDTWLFIMDRIQNISGWSNATLAGGALRDLDNGRQIKDVDIFVPFIGNDIARKTLQQMLADFIDHKLCELEHNTHNVSQVGTEGISHFQFEQDGWLFEISQITKAFDSKTLLDSFDIGLCMISLVGNAVYRRPEYQNDIVNKTITVIQETGGGEQIHAERIQKKYSGWRIIPL